MPNSKSSPAAGDLSGVMVIDKPRGPSSMTVVEHVRRAAGQSRTGHAGTLDPLATGVLVIAIGKATKLIDQLMATDKRYQTTIDLGAFTSTDDLEGERTEIEVHSPSDETRVREALGKFVGAIMQRPPAFSAVKVAGQRAYKAARGGKALEIAPRQVVVRAIELVAYQWPVLDLRIHCDKGFYVRSLARELGEALGTGGHCTAIRRTAVGPFTLEIAQRLEELPPKLAQSDLISSQRALEMVSEHAE